MISEVHRWNSLVSFCLSMLLNALLIWLVRHKSPQQMRQYSRILLQTAAVDIALSTAMEVVQPISFNFNNASVVYLNGPLLQGDGVGTLSLFLAMQCWLLVFYVALFGVCVQFYYRYSVLVKNVPISMRRYLLLNLAPFSTALICTSTAVLACYPDEANARLADPVLLELLAPTRDSIRVGNYCVQNSDNRWTIAVALYLLLASLLCASIVVFCARRMVQHVRQSAQQMHNSVQKRTMELNRQLTRTLIVLAVVPLSLQCVSSFGVYLCNLSHSGSSELSLQMLCPLPNHWMPVLVPAVAILTIKPYRRALFLRSPVSSGVSPMIPPNLK